MTIRHGSIPPSTHTQIHTHLILRILPFWPCRRRRGGGGGGGGGGRDGLIRPFHNIGGQISHSFGSAGGGGEDGLERREGGREEGGREGG